MEGENMLKPPTDQLALDVAPYHACGSKQTVRLNAGVVTRQIRTNSPLKNGYRMETHFVQVSTSASIHVPYSTMVLPSVSGITPICRPR